MASNPIRLISQSILAPTEYFILVCGCFNWLLLLIILVFKLHGFAGTVVLVVFVLIGAWNLCIICGNYMYDFPTRMHK